MMILFFKAQQRGARGRVDDLFGANPPLMDTTIQVRGSVDKDGHVRKPHTRHVKVRAPEVARVEPKGVQPEAPRSARDLSDAEYQEIKQSAKYLSDVAYSTGELVGHDKRAMLRLMRDLSKSGRDTLLMDRYHITRDVAHQINNELDSSQVHQLRAQDMEDALDEFPGLRAIVEAAKPPARKVEPVAPAEPNWRHAEHEDDKAQFAKMDVVNREDMIKHYKAHRGEFLMQFSGRDAINQRNFVDAAEKAFGGDEIRSLGGGFTVQVDNGDRTMSTYMWTGSGVKKNDINAHFVKVGNEMPIERSIVHKRAVQEQSKSDFIPEPVQRALDALLSPLKRGAEGLAIARGTQARDGGRYAGEYADQHQADWDAQRARIADKIATIPPGPNRDAAQAYIDAHMPNLELTADERGWSRAAAPPAYMNDVYEALADASQRPMAKSFTLFWRAVQA